MRLLIKTYQLTLFIVISLIAIGCASEAKREEISAGVTNNENYEELNFAEEASADESIDNKSSLKKESSEISPLSSTRNWRKKAKQQLETIQDLAVILQDSTLDDEFRVEILSELKKLYPKNNLTELNSNNESLDFKKFNFKNAHDTLIVDFKNKKESLSATFVYELNTKEFGEVIEQIEQLKLITIQKK